MTARHSSWSHVEEFPDSYADLHPPYKSHRSYIYNMFPTKKKKLAEFEFNLPDQPEMFDDFSIKRNIIYDIYGRCS